MRTPTFRGRRPHAPRVLFGAGLLATAVLTAAAPAGSAGVDRYAPRAVGALPAFLLDPCVAGILGDVTADGSANVIDAQQIARASAGLTVSGTVSARLTSHGDVTGDGNANVIDAQQVARASAGLTVTFPIGEPMCGITVNTSTSGGGIDSNGYQVRLDGSLQGTVGATGSFDIEQLAIGDYTVSLDDIATNCTVTNGSVSRNVSVVESGTASVTFNLSCASNVGSIRVQNDTEGPKPGTNYTVTLDGVDTRDMVPGDGADSAVQFDNVSAGSHTVTLGNVPGNCSVNNASVNLNVSEGGLTQYQWVVTCS